MVMKRFEIIEKLYLFTALLKMAGGGMHPPHLSPGSAPVTKLNSGGRRTACLRTTRIMNKNYQRENFENFINFVLGSFFVL